MSWVLSRSHSISTKFEEHFDKIVPFRSSFRYNFAYVRCIAKSRVVSCSSASELKQKRQPHAKGEPHKLSGGGRVAEAC